MPLSKIVSEVGIKKIYNIIGLAYRVYNYYHSGLQESAYHAALDWELRQNGFEVDHEQMFNLWYRGIQLEKKYKIDLVVEKSIILELKSKPEITSEHRLQLFNYMRLVNLPIGLIINFGPNRVDVERYRLISDQNKIVRFDNDGIADYRAYK